MNPIVFHIVSGHAFFSGMALLFLSIGLSCFSEDITKRFTVATFSLGASLIAISATPIPYLCYGVVLLGAIAWIVSYFFEDARFWCRLAFVGTCCVALLFEIPYHVYFGLEPSRDRTVTVIGDSITAGMGASDQSDRWPNILAQKHDLKIQDLSHPGGTAKSAHDSVLENEIESSLVIVEIGGNDLLGATTSREFRRDLDSLLAELRAPNRQIVMLELPLPPLHNEYGRIQRSLAWKYDVVLVPKRHLLSIVAPENNTVDTVHLTQRGHDKMALTMWDLIESAY